MEVITWLMFREEGKSLISLYGREIYWICEIVPGIKTYKFCIPVTLDRKHIFDREYKEIFELITFVHTCDLSKYQTKVKRKFLGEEEHESIEVDWKAIVDEVDPTLWQYTEERLNRRNATVIPKKVVYDGNYCTGYEFLEFTKDSAASWGGPFDQDGKEGACMKLKQTDFKNDDKWRLHYPVYNVESQFSFYDLPQSIKNSLDKKYRVMYEGKDCGNGANTVYSWSEKGKISFFNSMSAKNKFLTAERYYKEKFQYSSLNEDLMTRLPYKIYMCGNDDCSYSKWFATRKEMRDEVLYLRKMQPLDFYIDICERGYIFTN
jgi:hypothetical protein